MGKEYRWKGSDKFTLRDGESGELIACFRRQRMTVGKDGVLEVYKLGEGMVDVIVMSFMMVLYRQRDEESG
jgi:hypothetical protein